MLLCSVINGEIIPHGRCWSIGRPCAVLTRLIAHILDAPSCLAQPCIQFSKSTKICAASPRFGFVCDGTDDVSSSLALRLDLSHPGAKVCSHHCSQHNTHSWAVLCIFPCFHTTHGESVIAAYPQQQPSRSDISLSMPCTIMIQPQLSHQVPIYIDLCSVMDNDSRDGRLIHFPALPQGCSLVCSGLYSTLASSIRIQEVAWRKGLQVVAQWLSLSDGHSRRWKLQTANCAIHLSAICHGSCALSRSFWLGPLLIKLSMHLVKFGGGTDALDYCYC
jgi:hypothetical protein